MTQVPELLPASKVAEIFGVARQTVYRWAEEGLIPCQRTPSTAARAGVYRFPRAEIEALRDQGIKPGAAAPDEAVAS